MKGYLVRFCVKSCGLQKEKLNSSDKTVEWGETLVQWQWHSWDNIPFTHTTVACAPIQGVN